MDLDDDLIIEDVEDLPIVPPASLLPPPLRSVPSPKPAAAPTLSVVPAPRAPAPAASSDGGESLLREALSKASREVIERIAWEVVPELAETIIREELERLLKERGSI